MQGGGSVFVFSFDGEKVESVDVNLEQEGIQGIQLEGNTPELVLRDDGQIVSIGICSELTVNLENCQSRVELIYPESLSTEVVWNLDGENLRMNGPTVLADQDSLFVAGIQGIKAIFKLDYMEKTLNPLFLFSENSGGFLTLSLFFFG